MSGKIYHTAYNISMAGERLGKHEQKKEQTVVDVDLSKLGEAKRLKLLNQAETARENYLDGVGIKGINFDTLELSLDQTP